MMISTQNPVLDHCLTPSELHELFSFLHSQPSINSTSSSETNRLVYSTEERKRRRMISNRESARRSRWRKKRHLEDLTNEVNRLKLENRDLKNHLCILTHDCHVVERDSNRLLSESIYLRQKFAGLQQILAEITLLQ